MTEGNRTILNKTAVATVAGIGVCFFVAKYRMQILYKLKTLLNYKDPLRYQRVHVVTSVDECRVLMQNLKQ